MDTYRLLRKRDTLDGKGVIGSLINPDGKEIAVTYELPYIDNKPFVSSIPTGVYKCRLKYSISKGRVYELIDVPARDGILIHIGNSHNDTEGCILVGSKADDDYIVRSRIAMGILLTFMPDSFRLIVLEDY